ncbi:MAG: 6-bladed beta-propeller [Cytophagales bacterium]|nr:6-bladed beta-propeller [Cytophagales bacterium]
MNSFSQTLPGIIFSFLFLCSCSNTSNNNNLGSQNMAIPIPEENIDKFSEVFNKVNYITVQLPLESSIGQADKVIITEDNIFIGDFYQNPKVIILDKEGNFLSCINAFGEGPGEYTQINDFVIHHEDPKVLILSTKKILAFDFNGNFVEELDRPISGGYKFLATKKDELIFYVPPNISSADPKHGDNILFSYENQKVHPFFTSKFMEEKIPFFADRNILVYLDNKTFFTKHFSDTIYVFEGKELKEKMYLDFENSRKLKLNIFQEHDSNILNNLEYMQDYVYHMPNLHLSGKYLVTCFREKNYRSTLLYNRTKKTSKSISNATNDLDGLLPYLNVKYLSNNTLISVHYPDEFITIEQMENSDHPLLESLQQETVSFVFAIYQIKD